MVAVVTDKIISSRALKQRLSLFFKRAKSYDLGIAEVIRCTQSVGQTAIFGGMLRDLLLYGEEGFKSDTDLVVASDTNSLEDALNIFSPERNAFGGYRLNYKYSKIDVWCLSDTWAFREGLVSGRDFQDLVKTTFFNWDAIAFLLDDNDLFLGDSYLESIAKRVLDINLEPNPNPLGVLKRTFVRAYKDNAILTPRLVIYLGRVLDSMSEKTLNQEIGNRNNEFLTFCASLRKHIEEAPMSTFELRPQLALWSNRQSVTAGSINRK